MEIAAIIGAYDGLKKAGELVTAAWGNRVDSAAQPKIQEALEKVGKAQATIYEMRDALFKLQGENHELRLRQAAIDSWAETAARFSMVKTEGGAYVWRHLAEPPYYACPSCYNKKEILPLQDNRTQSGIYRCVACEATYPIEPRRPNNPQPPLSYPNNGLV